MEDEIKNGNVWGWSVLDNDSPPVKKMMMPRQDQYYKCMLSEDQTKTMEDMKKDKDDVFVLARKVILGTYSDGSKAYLYFVIVRNKNTNSTISQKSVQFIYYDEDEKDESQVENRHRLQIGEQSLPHRSFILLFARLFDH